MRVTDIDKGLTAERLRALLHYDPETGAWTRIKARKGWAKGSNAGSPRPDGRLIITVDRKRYYASRLAVLYMTGCWPSAQVDHRDTDKANDRWRNLRHASDSQNKMNTPIPRRNTSGLKGVSWHKRTGTWRADIAINGQQKSLGHYDCPAAAHLAYVLASAKLHGEFGRAA